MRALAPTKTRIVTEITVRIHVEPFPRENAAPGLRMRFSRSADPTRSTASPGVSEASAHALVAWSSTRVAAARPSSTAYSRRRPPVGTGAGVSGLWLLRGMRPDGVLTTVDKDPEHQRAARQAFTEAGIPSGRARLINGAALEVLPRLAEVQQPWLGALQHLLGDLHDRALDAAARHGARDLAVLVDGHLGAGRPWRGALDRDHGGQRDRVAALAPDVDVLQHVLHDSPSSIRSASDSSEAIELPGSRWSTCGRAARMPRVSGS